MLTYIHTHIRTTEAYLYYKLTNETIGSGELIMAYFHLSHYKSMETLSCHSNKSTCTTAIKNIAFVEANVMNISETFKLYPPYGF